MKLGVATEAFKLNKYIYIYIYPKNVTNKITSQKRWTQENTSTLPDESPQDKKRAPPPYIHTVSEITARVLRQYNIEVAHKPTHKLADNFTRSDKDRTQPTQTATTLSICSLAVMAHNCQYIGETSKKVETRLTEHSNAIKQHDPKSLPESHADDYEHSFNWSQTEI